MKNKLHYLFIGVFYFAFFKTNAQQKQNENMIKLKEALSNVDANGRIKDSIKVVMYYELLKEQLLKNKLKENDSISEATSEESITTSTNFNTLYPNLEIESKETNSIVKEEVDCKINIQEAKVYFITSENNKENLLRILEYLKPCLDKENNQAQLLLGKIYLSKGTEEAYAKAFKLFRKSANQENADAMVELGILYKYGKGCSLNFNKARKWFKKSANLGNSKAAYSLGYLYLKGFGSINQDYSKAVKWFKKSDYPMAQYWLGVCYVNGYGVEKDIKKAKNFLELDFSIDDKQQKGDEDVVKVLQSQKEEATVSEELELNEDALLGKWKGKLLKMDWSDEYVEEKIDFTLEFVKDESSGSLKSVISANGNLVEGEVVKLDNTVYFSSTILNLPHKSYSKKIPPSLLYQFLSSDLKIKNFNSLDYLIGNTESYIEKWKEEGAPLRFVLKRQETFENSDEELSDEVLKALSEQEDNFIQLYPNPFQNDLIIAYDLIQPAKVKVQINDLNGNLITVVKRSKKQEQGTHRYFFDASRLQKGAYIVSVFVNNERKTKITIKK